MSDYIIHNGELYHHGVKGMRWGYRKYQNEDGSLNNDGRWRVGWQAGLNEQEREGSSREHLRYLATHKTYTKRTEKLANEAYKKTITKEERDALKEAWKDYENQSAFSKNRSAAKAKYESLLDKCVDKIVLTDKESKNESYYEFVGRRAIKRAIDDKISKRNWKS